MDFGLVTVARAAQLPAARATIDSARRAGFRGSVHAVVLGLGADPSTTDPEWISYLSVMAEPSTARLLAPLGFDALWLAAVPSAILHALRTQTTVVYLAPSVHVLAPLDEIAAVADHRVALIDRPAAGAPDDGRHPNEADLVRGHRYSTSIVAATRRGRAALEWWRDTAWAALLQGELLDPTLVLDRLARRFGAVTPPRPGRYADWYSLGVDRVRDDGVVVTVDDRPLVSIDLGERDARHPHRIDSGQPLPHRVTLSDLPTLAAQLESRPATPDVDDGPALADGLHFDRVMRATYGAHLREAFDHGADLPPNPYDDPRAFVAWLHGSDFPGSSRVSRYLRQVYLSRPDLSRAFPEVPGSDSSNFFAWARNHGRDEIPIPPAFLPSETATPAARTVTHAPAKGVNLAGFLDDALGIGEVARRIGASLAEAATPYVTVPYTRMRRSEDTSEPRRSADLYDINVVCINPDSLASFARHAGDEFFAERYTIGVWFWETAVLPPSFGWAFELVDEVWCASDFVVDAVAARAHGRAPVWKFPLAITEPVTDPMVDRSHFGLPEDRFVFVHSFDYLSVVERKNPLGAIEAFRRAFPSTGEAVLVVKSINGDVRADDHARVRHAARGRSDIMVIDQRLAATANASLIGAADCVVSLHRSEGFGFNLADALALGRPVIATAYGGNLEFMDGLDEWLVPYELIDVGEDRHPYPSDAQWADPDLDAAATIMRSMFEDPARARERAEQARQHLTVKYSLARAGSTIAGHLAEIGNDRSKRERRGLRRR